MRIGQAQGMHIDGQHWKLSRQETETRRRLWTQIYILDKTIALALGRPFAIVDRQCSVSLASNVWLDDMDEADAENAPERPLSEPTLGWGSRLAHELAVVIGKIQEEYFGSQTVSYDCVMALEKEIVSWESCLPSYFKLENTDMSKDESLPWLRWTRLFLHSMFHFARVTLHRPFLLQPSATPRFRTSHDACMSSAYADLHMRLEHLNQNLRDRMKWALGPHAYFNSALVLGIMAVRDPASPRSEAIVKDLSAYCRMQRNDMWANEFVLDEVKIVELCIKKVRQSWTSTRLAQNSAAHAAASGLPPYQARFAECMTQTETLNDLDQRYYDGLSGSPLLTGPVPMPTGNSMMWDEQSFALLEIDDLFRWEHVLNSIMQDSLNA